MACPTCITASTTVNYIPAILNSQEETIITAAKVTASSYLSQAITYAQASIADAQMKYEAKANYYYQIIFTLERSNCLTESQRRLLISKIGSLQ